MASKDDPRKFRRVIAPAGRRVVAMPTATRRPRKKAPLTPGLKKGPPPSSTALVTEPGQLRHARPQPTFPRPPPPIPVLHRERAEVLRLLSKASKLAELPEDVAAFVLAVVHNIPLPPSKKLLEHQGIGVAYGLVSRFRFLLGDAQGLGKTAQGAAMLSLMLALAGPRLFPAVVIAPASVLIDWTSALQTWSPWLYVVPLLKQGDHVMPPQGRPVVYVTTWDLLPWHEVGLRQVGARTLLADEASFGKHTTARRSEALAALARDCPHAMFLSGTAAENKVEELWHVLHMLDPQRFNDRTAFRELAQDRELMVDLLPEYMVRRLKTDVLAALPPKTRTVVHLALPAEALARYRAAERDMLGWTLGKRREKLLVEAVNAVRRQLTLAKMAKGDMAEAEVLEAVLTEYNGKLASTELREDEAAVLRFGELRRLVGQAKIIPALRWLHNWFTQGPGAVAAGGGAFVLGKTPSDRPVILFAEHQAVIEGLRNGCAKLGIRLGVIDGNTSKAVRRQLTQAFQAGKLDAILGSQAMAYGVTLTRSCDVTFVERWFVPAKEEQAEDRAHRITQTREVTVRQLVALGTVDEAVAALVSAKQARIAEVMGAEDVDEQAGRAALDWDQGFATQVAGALVGLRVGAGEGADARTPFTAEELRRALGTGG